MLNLPHLDLPVVVHAQGGLRLPGSKSISNRVLLLAGLARGATTLEGLLASDDTEVMQAALRQLGCRIEPAGDRTTVEGLGARALAPTAELHLGNAGTAMRPLAAALAILAAQRGGDYTLSGVARMHERPIGDLVAALRGIGCTVDELGQPNYPPLRLRGGTLRLDDPVRVRGDVSSQFLSALLMALPLAADSREVVVEVVGELISKPYVDITLRLLERFGIAVRRDGWRRFTIPQGSVYRSPGRLAVEGDASSASYFVGLGALAAVDAPVVIYGLGRDSIQGDVGFLDAAEAMGARVTRDAERVEVRRGAWPLRPLDLDCNAIPDAAMTLAVMALYADGPTRLHNIASWRVKETDRIDAMSAELRKLGAEVEAAADQITVTPPARWHDAVISTYDDHRMAMCFALAACAPPPGAAASTQRIVRILDPRCVGKTYPEFFEDFFAIASADAATIPVITVDGPTASGKGTLAAGLAQALGWQHLDSGALYRSVALMALRRGLRDDDAPALAALAQALVLRFEGGRILVPHAHGGQPLSEERKDDAREDISAAIRAEPVGAMASRISALPEVRAALRAAQLGFRRLPGLVADGRDMGTVIFPDAPLKVFLTASAEERARRRTKQLISNGKDAILDDVLRDLRLRDARDTGRSAAPLVPAADALRLDNSRMSADDSVQQVLAWWNERLAAKPALRSGS